ncbi:MAG: aminomethyl-transferring glycine dehydrogenase subunit GcvPA [Chloroflexi bacterium]|nr:aminomethyl-transferring glycine dehydrogenase subunit GcvPA [Chloroflexota bacterium]
MLSVIGVEQFEDLIADIPSSKRSPKLRLRPATPELDLVREMAALSDRNHHAGVYSCFLGGGAYRHFIPAVVKQIVSRGEYMTSYTPYQPEVAQGTLQTAFEFQSLVALLMGMEIANAGMYDGPTAFAEGALMACRVTKRNKLVALRTVSPRLLEVVRSYTGPQGIRIELLPEGERDVPGDVACLLIQSPNGLGIVEDLTGWSKAAHASGALIVASVNPTAIALFKSPGECDVDIATAEGQALGVPLSFGGAYVGLFTCKAEYVRQMPGRIVGRTTDTKGRTGYVLTLQTREQHIRRERATSNICTSTQLIGLMVTAYLAAMGKHGLREVAELCYHKAHYAADQIYRIPGYSLPVPGTFFHEFVVGCPLPPKEINARLLEHGIIGGLDVSDRVKSGMLVCVTEMNTRSEIDGFASALREIGAGLR